MNKTLDSSFCQDIPLRHWVGKVCPGILKAPLDKGLLREKMQEPHVATKHMKYGIFKPGCFGVQTTHEP